MFPSESVRTASHISPMLQSKYSQIRSRTDRATSSLRRSFVIVPVAIFKSLRSVAADISFSTSISHSFLQLILICRTPTFQTIYGYIFILSHHIDKFKSNSDIFRYISQVLAKYSYRDNQYKRISFFKSRPFHSMRIRTDQYHYISLIIINIICVSFSYFQMCQNNTCGSVEITLQEMSFLITTERIGNDQYHYNQYYLYQYYYIVFLTTLELSKRQFKNFPNDNSKTVFPQRKG